MRDKQDRRQRYTQMVIKQTLLELMTTRAIDKITVSELCQKADINRGTFYLHYVDIYALLTEVEDEISADIKLAVKKMTMGNQLDMLIGICRYIQSNALFARAYFSEHGNKQFIRKIMAMAKDYFVQEYHRQNLTKDQTEVDYLYHFFVQGVLGILQRWASQDFRDTPDSIGQIINRLDHAIKVGYDKSTTV